MIDDIRVAEPGIAVLTKEPFAHGAEYRLIVRTPGTAVRGKPAHGDKTWGPGIRLGDRVLLFQPPRGVEPPRTSTVQLTIDGESQEGWVDAPREDVSKFFVTVARWIARERGADPTPRVRRASRNGGDRSSDDLRHLVAFPLVTQGAGGGDGGEGSLPSRARRVLRTTLGAVPSTATAEFLKAQLETRTERYERNGATLIRWRDRAAGIARVASGQVSGAQAAELSFVVSAHEAVRPLVEELKPLVVGADPEQVEASRQVLLDLLDAVPDAVGAAGGWSTAIVRDLGENLPAAADAFGEALGMLTRVDGGLDSNRAAVINAAEEQARSEFLILQRWVVLVGEHLRALADDEHEPDFGSASYRLQRGFGVVSTTVGHVRSMCEQLVGFGPQEREAYVVEVPVVDDGDGDGDGDIDSDGHAAKYAGTDDAADYEDESAASDTITFEGLLDWVDDVLGTRLPSLAESAGLPALQAAERTVSRIHAALEAVTDDDDAPLALRHPVVHEAVAELSDQVGAAHDELTALLYRTA